MSQPFEARLVVGIVRVVGHQPSLRVRLTSKLFKQDRGALTQSGASIGSACNSSRTRRRDPERRASPIWSTQRDGRENSGLG